MSHENLCFDWVEEHKLEDDEGLYWISDAQGNPVDGPFIYEEIDDILWRRVLELSLADLCGH